MSIQTTDKINHTNSVWFMDKSCYSSLRSYHLSLFTNSRVMMRRFVIIMINVSARSTDNALILSVTTLHIVS